MAAAQAPPPPVQAPAPSRSTQTFRYLRLSIVLLAVFLAVAVAIEAWWGDSPDQGSISAYYYTPVRGVFVGTLVAMGLGLIAVHGREWGYEDVLLNLSGMLAPVVALVPTPVLGTADLPCPAGVKADEKCVPAAFEDGVVNNLSALAVLAAVALLVAAWTTRHSRQNPTKWKVGFAVAATVVGLAVAVFVVDRDFFLRWAHYGAAIPMFGFLVVVGVVNGLATDDEPRQHPVPVVPGVTSHLKQWYLGLAIVMCVVVVAAVVYGLSVKDGPWETWLFWVEVLLLVLFSAFWILQTIEFWNEGLPPPTPAPTPAAG